VDWISVADEKRARFEQQYGDADERSLVRAGNSAYAAGLALLMAGDDGAREWLRRAAARWRESWDAGAATDAWGRPIGAIKASLLARDEAAVEELARWTLQLGTATAPSPIGRYAAALALLALGRWPEARHVAESLRERDDFPRDVADALATISADDVVGYVEAVESVVESFETRAAYLEDVRVADTALVLAELARRRGIEQPLPPSETLP
jgi:ribosomal protein S18 acetylase RimI-like enzyme